MVGGLGNLVSSCKYYLENMGGAADGFRTRYLRSGGPTLYRLSYCGIEKG